MSDSVRRHTFTRIEFAALKNALASEDGLRKGDTISYGYSGPNLASLTIGSWFQTITRDSALRPHSITSPAGTFTYGYSGAGRKLASLQFPGGTTTFTYDAIGEPKTIQVKNSAQTLLDYHAYDYDLDGFVTNVTRLNSVNAAYGYDGIGQLVKAQGFEGNGARRLNENLGYAYDASGNLAFRTNNTLLQSFTCDALNQLAGVTRAGSLTVVGSVTGAVTRLCVNGTNAQIYSDATFATTNGLTLNDGNNLFVTAGSNAVGELVVSTVTRTRLPSSVSFSYDLNGNLLSDGLKAYAYDDANQLTNVTAAGQWKTHFVYDGLGRRRITREYTWSFAIGSWLLTNETRYVCDGSVALQERDSNNVVQVTYTRGLDLSGRFQGAGGIGGLLARSEGSSHAFYHPDVGGNVTSLTDPSGNVGARYLYDPFGNLLGKWGALADANRYRFSSKEAHGPSGLYYYGFRFYDANIQRWLTQDPRREYGGLNLYRFVRNDPVDKTDPSGEKEHNTVASAGCAVGPPRRVYARPVLLPPIPPGTPVLQPAHDSVVTSDFLNAMSVGDMAGTEVGDEIADLTASAITAPLPFPKIRCLSAAKRGISAYEVGTYDALKARSLTGDGLDIHHVGQTHPFEQLIPGYDRATAPAISLPEVEHGMMPTAKGTTTMTPRDILANDIRNLRNLTEAPNSSLQQLIDLNKQMYPNAFQK
jgi:RHS repeat-associated protein